MKNMEPLFLFGILLCIPYVLKAQSHPTLPEAVLVASTSASIPAPSPALGADIDYEMTIWSIGGGNYDYVLDVRDIEFSGDGCTGLPSVLLSEIVQAIGDDAIKAGVKAGYPGCGSTTFDKDVRIFVQSCASRSGSGCSTTFTPRGSSWSYLLYNVYCNGSEDATITQETGQESDCSDQTGWEPTVGAGSNLQ